MKKLLFALMIVSTIMSLSLTGCETDDTTVPLTKEQLIAGKWTIKSAISHSSSFGTLTKDTTNYTANDYLEFKADGTLAALQTNVSYTGKWKILNDKLYISESNYLDNSAGYDLPVLTSSALELFTKSSVQNGAITLELTLKLKK